MKHPATFPYRLIDLGLAQAGAFITGWVTAGTQFATEVNEGLVTALPADCYYSSGRKL